MPMGPASRPGWFVSTMLHIFNSLERLRLFMEDIVCISKNDGEYVSGLWSFRTAHKLRLEPSTKENTPRGKGGEGSAPQISGGDSA